MVRKVLAEFDAVDGPFLQKLSRIDKSIMRFETGALSGLGRVEKGIGGLVMSAGRLEAVGTMLAGAFGAQMGTAFLDQATRIRNGLQGIGEDSEENFNKLYLAATRSMIGMQDFSQAVMRFQKVMGDRQGIDQTIRQVETLSKLMALSGKGAGERASVVTQFTQALQSGVLQGDELRSLRENAPVEFLQALSAELGGTTADLKAFGEQGRITTDVMVAALTKLEAEADRRMKDVQMTFADAATVMGNGALKAAAAFDEGFGLTRIGTAALKELGEILGENAEAFEMVGKAVQIFAAFMGATYLGRRVQEASAALTQFYAAQTTGVRAAVDSAQKTQAAEALVVAAKEKTVLALQAKIAAMTAEGAAEAKLTAMQGRLATAEAALTTARARHTTATLALAAAQARVNVVSRATIAAGNMMRSAWAFLGGWPGLILMAGTAMLTLAGNARTLTDVFADAAAANDSAKAAADALASVQDRLNEAVKEYGNSSDQAHRRVIANLQAELFLASQKLEAEIKAQEEIQRTLRIEQGAAIARAKAKEAEIADLQSILDATRATSSDPANDEDVLALENDVRKAKAELAGLTEEANSFNLQLLATGISLDNNVSQLNTTKGILASIAAEDALGKARAAAQALKGWLDGSADSMGRIAGSDVSSPIARAAGWAQALFGWLSKAASVAVPGAGPSGSVGPAFERGGRNGSGLPPFIPAAPTLDDLIAQNAGSGGGGGGGSSRVNADMQEALRLVEEMMTAEERRAKELSEMVKLRERLVATYGPEAEIVGRVDEAIQRAQANLAGLSDGMTEFWDTLSDNVSQSIEEWRGWGNFVRSLLADMARKWGPDFFTALFTPGQQTGGGFGQVLGNLLTGNGSLKAGSMSAPALAMRGVALPAAQAAGNAVTIVQHNDFRGADPSMRAEIQAQLNRRDRELRGKVLETIREAKRARIPLA